MFAREKRETYRGIVQLVEYRSPKPRVVGSNPTAPASGVSAPTGVETPLFFFILTEIRHRRTDSAVYFYLQIFRSSPFIHASIFR